MNLVNFALALTALVGADVLPGPKVGDKVAALKIAAVVGPWAGKQVDAAAERKDADTVYVFVTDGHWNRPAARYLKVLEIGMAKAPGTPELIVIWLTNQPEESKNYLQVLQQSVRFGPTVTLAVGTEKGGPPGWNVSETDRLTTVVAHGGKVAATFAPNAVGEADAENVLAALKKAAGGK
ncbi:MAG TPA: hypothetical protein VL371_05460 [Gemmataceae bacterium]|jgi:hypothetical protein|nr:hypothetical protein [Gemmataceae bacterium]